MGKGTSRRMSARNNVRLINDDLHGKKRPYNDLVLEKQGPSFFMVIL